MKYLREVIIPEPKTELQRSRHSGLFMEFGLHDILSKFLKESFEKFKDRQLSSFPDVQTFIDFIIHDMERIRKKKLDWYLNDKEEYD